MPRCGDGQLDEGEACDGSDLANQTCATLGFESGQLSCTAECQFAKGLCVKRCGNGQLDPGEACDGTLGLMRCTTFGSYRCTESCEQDGANCVSQAFEAAPELTVTNGGPAVIADLAPAGSGELVMAVPSRNRVEVFSWSTVQGFAAMTSRKLSFQRSAVACLAGDFSGDGLVDVATLNDTGEFDAYVGQGSTFSLRELDGGCVGAKLIGVARAGPRRDIAIASGCGSVFALETAGVRRFEAPDASAVGLGDVTGDGFTDVLVAGPSGSVVSVLPGPQFARDAGLSLNAAVSQLAAADLDGDGDADLAGLVGGDLVLFENTGAGFAEKLTFSAPRPFSLELADFDLDGVPDVFFASGDDVVVRRNRGGWIFSEFRQAVGAGTRLSVATGDVDGDGDLDVAVTFATGGDTTRTAIVRNRAR